MILESLINTYASRIGAPRTAVNTRREATQSLEELFSRGDELCLSLDRLLLQRKDTAFYKVFKSARKVLHLRPRGQVVSMPAEPATAEKP